MLKLKKLPEVGKVHNYLGRCYIVNKQHFPSVSTILSETMPVGQRMALKNWRKGLGDNASQVQEDAKQRGKNFHRLIECWAKKEFNEVLKICDIPEMQSYLDYALPLLKHINKGETILTEAQVFSYKHRYAGTLDMLGYQPDPSRYVLLDWKTSNKPKKKEYCDHHFLQLAAYANALKETYGVNVHGATVVIFYSFQEPTIFSLKPDEISEWFEKFLERLKAFRIKTNPLSDEAFEEYYAQFQARNKSDDFAPGAGS
jgi:genome maintenance exonuclease 1